MEFIKKTIQRIMTTGTTTGCTGTCRIFIPNTGVTYNFKLLLTKEVKDNAFLDAYAVSGNYTYVNLLGATTAITKTNTIKFKAVTKGTMTLDASGLPMANSNGIVTGATLINTSFTVTGKSTSRLVELRKNVTTSVFKNKYISGGTLTKDGVDYINSIDKKRITYYLGGIKYIDIPTGVTSGTTFRFLTSGTSSPNFINLPTYKNPNKGNLISNPKINDDVFIIRQELPVFEKNYRLEYIKNLVDLETYASGKYFNIVNNT